MEWRPTRNPTIHRDLEIENRVGLLKEKFEEFLSFYDSQPLFGGPSLYFHVRTIARLRDHGADPTRALSDDAFLESLYATLISWGMHRMGKGGPKLVPFNTFKLQLLKRRDEIGDLQNTRIDELGNDYIDKVVPELFGIITKIGVSATRSQLVAGSKVLHHLLPKLVPPIDREYTSVFFQETQMQQAPGSAFNNIFKGFVRIAREAPHVSERRDLSLEADQSPGAWRTSLTKIMDNAIIVFVQQLLPRPEKGGDAEEI